jgi:hypothetical protein
MKTLSITQLKRMPVKQLERLISRHEVQITRYGQPKAVMVPLGPYFSASKLQDFERQCEKCDQGERDKNIAEIQRELREAQQEEVLRKWENRKIPVPGKRNVSGKHHGHLAGLHSRKRGKRKPDRGKSKNTSGLRKRQ